MAPRLSGQSSIFGGGVIKDRYIGETVRSIFDIMELTVEENIPGLMIFIDLQKAFHSLEWNYLWNYLIRWVATFYKNIQSCHKQWYYIRLFYPSKRREIHFLLISL